MGVILLLEDEDSVNRGITFTLEKEGYTVYPCRTIREADKALERGIPDVLICDITLPDGSGLDFVRKVKNAGSTYIICLTALDTETDYVMGYGAGADDYIAKPFSLSVLTLKVHAVFRRRNCKEEEELFSGLLRVRGREGKVWKQDQEINLTGREWKLFMLFLDHPGQILSKNQILERLFDLDGGFVDDNTVAVNIRRLREKIETDPARPEYIKNVRGIGYVWSMECRR